MTVMRFSMSNKIIEKTKNASRKGLFEDKSVLYEKRIFLYTYLLCFNLAINNLKYQGVYVIYLSNSLYDVNFEVM